MYISNDYAGIDIGSNAIRLLIANVVENDSSIEIKKNILIRIPIRLGEDVFKEGKISDKKMMALSNTLTGFNYIMKAHDVTDYRAYATSAMREAVNNEEVVKYVLENSGIDIRIIDGQTEAAIIFSGGETVNISDQKDYMYVDVGGGSTEITIFYNNQKVNARSFPLGTVRMLSQGVNEKEIVELKDWLVKTTQLHKPNAIVGTGGNINKVQKLLNKKPKEPLTFDEINQLCKKIKNLTIEERIKTMKMNESRADVIVPAMEIFLYIMEISKISQVFVPKVGLADGIIRQLYLMHKQK